MTMHSEPGDLLGLFFFCDLDFGGSFFGGPIVVLGPSWDPTGRIPPRNSQEAGLSGGYRRLAKEKWLIWG